MKFRAAPLLAAWLLGGLSISTTPASGQAPDAANLDRPGLVLDHPGARSEDPATFGSRRIFVENGAILRLGDRSNQGAAAYVIDNNIQLDRGTIESVSGNPHFTGSVIIGPGGATFITRSRGHDLYFDVDVTGTGPLVIDNAGPDPGGTVHFTNEFSLMGTVTVNGRSPGFTGGRISLEDPDALNQATLVTVAGMRGIDFAPGIKAFSFGGLAGDGNIDLKGKIMRVGIVSTDTVYSGDFTDSVGGGGLIKSGSGTLTLTGRFSSGPSLTVYIGALVVAGSVEGEIKVGNPQDPLAPALLGGTGSVGDILEQTPGAVVRPGTDSATGILTARNFSMIPGSNLSIRLGGALPGGNGLHGYDQIRASGQFSLYGNLEVSLAAGFHPRPGDAFYIMTTSGAAPVLGRFCNLVSDEFTVAGHPFRVTYTADSAGNNPAATTGHDVALIALADK